MKKFMHVILIALLLFTGCERNGSGNIINSENTSASEASEDSFSDIQSSASYDPSSRVIPKYALNPNPDEIVTDMNKVTADFHRVVGEFSEMKLDSLEVSVTDLVYIHPNNTLEFKTNNIKLINKWKSLIGRFNVSPVKITLGFGIRNEKSYTISYTYNGNTEILFQIGVPYNEIPYSNYGNDSIRLNIDNFDELEKEFNKLLKEMGYKDKK